MHRKILIVGTVPYNRQSASRAFDSYFHNWEHENIAQIFSDPRKPVKGHCGTLYQITDRMMLNRHLNKRAKVGKIYYIDDLDAAGGFTESKTSNFFISLLYKLGSRKCALNHLLRKWLWKKEYWCTEKLIRWMDDFHPECVFLAFSDDFFIPEIALYAARRFDVPIVSCIGDDYYFNDRFSLSPFYQAYRKKYKLLIDSVFAHGGSAAYIGNKIRDKYNKEFHLNGDTVYLTSEIKRQPFRAIRTLCPKIVYCGNLRLGRNSSLVEVADVLRDLNVTYRLTVFSNEHDKKFYKMLLKHPNIEYRGTVPYEQVTRELVDSDIVVVVEGFSKKDVDTTKYSLSTKVADSLACGRFVLGYGSEECGAIEYLKSVDCGVTCTSRSDLYRKLSGALQSELFQKQCYENAVKITEKNHNLKSSTAVFENVVEKSLEGEIRKC